MLTAASNGPPDPLTLLQQVFDVSDAMVRESHEIVTELGLTGSQVDLLWRLGRGRPPVPMRVLARQLQCDPSNVTLITDKMELAGLVVRGVHPTDGRQRVVSLTSQGEDVWDTLMTRLHEGSGIFQLPDADQRQLSGLLARILDTDTDTHAGRRAD